MYTPYFRQPVAASGLLALLILSASVTARAERAFTMTQILDYPYTSDLVAAEHEDVIAWVRNLQGVRNVWIARGPDYKPVQITHYAQDDGQELTQLTFTPDAGRVIYVRGGDHDANWPAEGNLAPDPDSATTQPETTIWSVAISGGEPVKIAEGDTPAISSHGQLAYTKDDHVWTASLDGQGKAERLFFDRGKDGELRWSPDGSRLAFVSDRGDHAFIGIYTAKDRPVSYLAPSTGNDSSPRWSTDGTRIAFVRQPGTGGAPQPLLKEIPHPWSIWMASVADSTGHAVWDSPDTLAGSFPDVADGANLHWAADDRLVFLAYLDDWPHLYSIAATGGSPILLTPGAFMVEHVTQSHDRRSMIYDANTGKTRDDDERRHLFRVAVDHPGASELTAGETLEWMPVSTVSDHVAYIASGVQQPPSVGVLALKGGHRPTQINRDLPADFLLSSFVTPRSVTFKAADGLLAHGQLFEQAGGTRTKGPKPGIIFVHGGPPRQMLLGWHYMDYYSNGYAVNQYLAAHGFVVLCVNYRLGIGYGRRYHFPEHAGPRGASEYQDVVAGARYLQSLPEVDPARIGIWGGSYGGYLTALALARDSDIFKAGVDLHGVHDWSALPDEDYSKAPNRYEKGDREEALRTAWESSPDASVDGWKGHVLLIQGDDDRNVPFQQTVDLARRLQAHKIPYEELVIPNEIHGFLRHASWLRADEATAEFLARTFGVHP
ncbi:MAG TPA: prolyl oligopeptidase family serine peptidase [Steroidobacteraceae bacterium]|jgi:dipeptidyl aminopeptidase/acylaminoacyl peptidase